MGRRKVGKSYIVKAFAAEHFAHSITLNFELEPQLTSCFATLKPVEIIKAIGVVKNQSIIPGQTLLFLDEIQVCPRESSSHQINAEALQVRALIHC